MATFNSPTLDSMRASRPAARIRATSRAFVATTIAITIASFAAAFLVSGFAQVWVGSRIGLPPVATIAVVAMIDFPLIAFGLGAISRASRGESTRGSYLWIGLFVLASVGMNLWHGFATTNVLGIEQIGLAAVSILAPVAILATSHQVLSILVAPPATDDKARLQALARVVDREALAVSVAAGSKAARPRSGSAEEQDLHEAIRTAYVAADGGVSREALAQMHRVSVGVVDKALRPIKRAAQLATA